MLHTLCLRVACIRCIPRADFLIIHLCEVVCAELGGTVPAPPADMVETAERIVAELEKATEQASALLSQRVLELGRFSGKSETGSIGTHSPSGLSAHTRAPPPFTAVQAGAGTTTTPAAAGTASGFVPTSSSAVASTVSARSIHTSGIPPEPATTHSPVPGVNNSHISSASAPVPAFSSGVHAQSSGTSGDRIAASSPAVIAHAGSNAGAGVATATSAPAVPAASLAPKPQNIAHADESLLETSVGEEIEEDFDSDPEVSAAMISSSKDLASFSLKPLSEKDPLRPHT